MVNRGEEKARVHMNVVPRSTGNTNSVAQRKSGTILDGESRRGESKGTYECCVAICVPDFLCATLLLSRQSDGRSNLEVVG